MGMYDNLRCEYPLDGLADPTAIDFQTKDFDCHLDDYRISTDGRLLIHEVLRYEDRSDKNAKPGSFASLAGCMTPVYGEWKDLNYHGWLTFYGNAHTGELLMLNLATGKDDAHPGQSPEWFEYNAKFTNGVITEVERDRRA